MAVFLMPNFQQRSAHPKISRRTYRSFDTLLRASCVMERKSRTTEASEASAPSVWQDFKTKQMPVEIGHRPSPEFVRSSQSPTQNGL